MKHEFSETAKHNSRMLRTNATEAERVLWQRLSRKQIHGLKFRRQVPIGKFIADFCCHEARLIVELDGAQHVDNQDHDNARTAFLQNAGYRVMRFWNNEVINNTDGVVERIASVLHHPHPNPSPLKGEGDYALENI